VSAPPLAVALDLAPHPEGGWFRETWRSELTLPADALPHHDGPRSAGTAIYFLLGPDERSAWHRVRSAELWLWHRGGPLTLRLGGSAAAPEKVEELVLGPDLEAGQHLQLLVSAGMWQSARPAADLEVLVSCVVVPGFDFADFTLSDGPEP
jgi:predicted cupin superfamily sugar epimerase